jgi:YbbR domain-containing protein
METTGWNLLTGSLKSEDRVVQIDLSPYSGDRITINTESLLDRVSESLSQDYRLISVYPSAVNLDYEALIYKTVPVKADVQMSYAEGFGFPEPFTLSPDSITISGIASDLESIDYWPTQSRTFNQLKKNIDTELDLERPEQFNIKLNFEKVRFEQEVSPVQSMELNVPIEVSGVPEGLTVTILPSEALLLFSTYESIKDELKPEDFFVVADFADSTAIGNGTIELSVKDTTDLVWDIILETPEVSFIFYEE